MLVKITKSMVLTEYNTLKAQNLREHDLRSIIAMHPDIKHRAAAAFLLREA